MVMFLEARAWLVNRCAKRRRIVPLSIALIRESSTLRRLLYHHWASSASVLNFGTISRSSLRAIIKVPFPPDTAAPAAYSRQTPCGGGSLHPVTSRLEPALEADWYGPLIHRTVGKDLFDLLRRHVVAGDVGRGCLIPVANQ